MLAIIDASAITAIRTAAVSGVATKLLAREDAKELAILGSGVQAHTHVNAMLAARQIGRVRVWSPNFDHAKAFVRNISEKQDITVTPTTNALDAVKGADIVCTTTSAREPVLMGDWLAVEDIASGHYVYRKALEKGLGAWVEFGGHRQISF